MTAWIVYQWTNTINGKRYIGYTGQTLKKRFTGHVSKSMAGSKYHFHSAIRKYSADVFVGEVLFVEKSEAAAKETEILLILDRQPEYNKTFGGEGVHGLKRPDIAEMNRASKGTKNPNKARKGEDNHWFGTGGPMLGKTGALCPNTGLVRSDETRAKQSASAKARAQTEEGKTNSSSAGRKGAEVRWAKHRAEKLAAQQSTEFSVE